MNERPGTRVWRKGEWGGGIADSSGSSRGGWGREGKIGREKNGEERWGRVGEFWSLWGRGEEGK